MAIWLVDNAHISDVTFRNITVENDSCLLKMCGQKSDSQVYCDHYDPYYGGFLVNFAISQHFEYSMIKTREELGKVSGVTLENINYYCLLLKAKNDKNSAKLIGNGTETFVIKNEQIEMLGKNGAGVSIFAFGARAEGVCIKGLKYEAEDIALSPDSSLGVSNSFTSRGVGAVCVKDGALLVIREI